MYIALHTGSLSKCFVCGTVGRLNSIGHSLCLHVCESSVGGLGETDMETESALLVGADVCKEAPPHTLKMEQNKAVWWSMVSDMID